MRYFRQTAFVRSEVRPDQTIDAERIADLWIWVKMRLDGDDQFVNAADRIEIKAPALAAALASAVAIYPQRVPLREVTIDPDQLGLVLKLFVE